MIRFTNMTVAGYLPYFFNESDPRGAVDQFDEAYAHGGGFHQFDGFTVIKHDDDTYSIKYPGDPAMREASRAHLRDELIILFPYDWAMFVAADGTHKICRAD